MNAKTFAHDPFHALEALPVASGQWKSSKPSCWMVIYDGSKDADEAVASGFERAQQTGSSLFLVAVDLRVDSHDHTKAVQTLNDDLCTFVRFASRAGLDVDGTVLGEASVDNLIAVADSHHVTGVIVTARDPMGLADEWATRSGLPRHACATHGRDGDAA